MRRRRKAGGKSLYPGFDRVVRLSSRRRPAVLHRGFLTALLLPFLFLLSCLRVGEVFPIVAGHFRVVFRRVLRGVVRHLSPLVLSLNCERGSVTLASSAASGWGGRVSPPVSRTGLKGAGPAPAVSEVCRARVPLCRPSPRSPGLGVIARSRRSYTSSRGGVDAGSAVHSMLAVVLLAAESVGLEEEPRAPPRVPDYGCFRCAWLRQRQAREIGRQPALRCRQPSSTTSLHGWQPGWRLRPPALPSQPPTACEDPESLPHVGRFARTVLGIGHRCAHVDPFQTSCVESVVGGRDARPACAASERRRCECGCCLTWPARG